MGETDTKIRFNRLLEKSEHLSSDTLDKLHNHFFDYQQANINYNSLLPKSYKAHATTFPADQIPVVPFNEQNFDIKPTWTKITKIIKKIENDNNGQ